MGTTAEKLQAIVNSKSAIKTAINNKGGSITDSTPLDEYATAISNIPTVDDLVNQTISGAYSNDTATGIRSNLFQNCTNLTSVSFSEATNIGQYAFAGCTSLTSFNLPKISNFASNCFSGCTSLASIDLDNVTAIGGSAFYNCSNLTTVSLKSSVSFTIQSSAFGGTSISTLKLDYNGVVTLASTNAFGTNMGITVYVPSDKISSYQTASNWSVLYNNNVVNFVAIPE